MKKKRSIIKFIQLWGIAFILGAGLSIIIFDTFNEYNLFKYHSDLIRKNHLENRKNTIRHEVMEVVSLIRNERAQAKDITKRIIKERVYEAHALATHLYKKYEAKKTKEELEDIIKEAIRPIRYYNGTGYYFILSLDGLKVLSADKPEMEGKNLSDYKNVNGKAVVKDIINIARQKGEGFYEYKWTMPDKNGNNYKKISFLKVFKPLNWVICTGLYIDDIEREIEQRLLKKISEIRFFREGYIFINRFNGDALISNGIVFSGKKKLWEEFDSNPEEIKSIFSKELKAAKKPDGDYIFYNFQKLTNPKKISSKVSFIYGIPELEWIVGAGVYLADMEKDILKMQRQLHDSIKRQVFIFTIISLFLLILFLYIRHKFNKRVISDISIFLSSISKAIIKGELINRQDIEFVELDKLARDINIIIEEKSDIVKRLQEEREKLFVTLCSIGEGVIASDKDGRIMIINKVGEELTGYEAESAQGMPITDVLRIVDSNNKDNVLNPIKEVIDGGEGLEISQGIKLISKDGKEYHITLTASPIKKKDSQEILGIIVVFKDVTEEHLIQERLLYNKQFLHTVIESIQDGISVLNPDLTIHYTNSIMKKWYSKNLPLEGKKCFSCFHNKSVPCAPCPSLRCMQTGKTETEIVRGLKGSPIEWLEIYCYPIRYPTTGEITGVVEFVRDITERKRAEDELQRLRRLESIGTLAGGIAHDFNNILQGIYGNIQLAMIKMEEDDPARAFLNNAERSMERAMKLTRQLLTFTKGGILIKEDVALDKFVKEIVQFELSGSSIMPVFEVDDDLWQVNVDKGQIGQVFSNLIINARDAMPDGGHIYISMKNKIVDSDKDENASGIRRGRYVEISVKDEGTGIDPSHIDKIFEPYFTTKEQGNGLGLATTYSIIKKHGGDIEVQSIVGKGTAFTVYLPVFNGQTDIKDHKKDTEKDDKITQKAKILVMDDEETIRDLVSNMLETFGHEVKTASNGEEAIRMYRDAMDRGQPFDLVILDLTVPGGMGGKETMERLLVIDPDVSAIVSSGYSDELNHYLEIGFKGVISKPYTINEVRRAVNNIFLKRVKG